MTAVDLTKLTRAERAVLGVLITGATNRQIGDALGSTEDTIKSHVRHIMQKFGARTRTQVAAMLHAETAAEPVIDNTLLARYLLDQYRGDVLAPIRALLDAAPGRRDCRLVVGGRRRLVVDVDELRRALAEAEAS